MEDWVETFLIDGALILDNLRKPINSTERRKRIEGKDVNELFPYYGATGQVGYIDDYLTEGEYVLIGEDGAPFFDYRKNVAYLIRGKTWVNNHAHILKSFFDNKFLCHYLNQCNYKDYVSGTTRLKLTQGSLKKLPIKIAPLPIQRAIVTKLETLFSNLDKSIEQFQTAQNQLKIYRQAVLKKAFEGELTKAWRSQQKDLPSAETLLQQIKAERQKHYDQQLADWQTAVAAWETKGKEGKKPSKPKKLKELPSLSKDELGELGELPEGWQWVRPEEICSPEKYSLGIGPFGSNLKVKDYTLDGVPLVFVKNITRNNFLLNLNTLCKKFILILS